MRESVQRLKLVAFGGLVGFMASGAVARWPLWLWFAMVVATWFAAGQALHVLLGRGATLRRTIAIYAIVVLATCAAVFFGRFRS